VGGAVPVCLLEGALTRAGHAQEANVTDLTTDLERCGVRVRHSIEEVRAVRVRGASRRRPLTPLCAVAQHPAEGCLACVCGFLPIGCCYVAAKQVLIPAGSVGFSLNNGARLAACASPADRATRLDSLAQARPSCCCLAATSS
jgi:hypothetical protein